MRFGFRLLVLCLIFLLAAGLPVWAQRGTSKLEGKVSDSSGAVLPGVSVTALNQETGVARETITNDAGIYVFPSLPVGVYSVSAELEGFKKTTVSDLKLDVAATAVYNFTMELGEITEEVTVTGAGTPLIQTTTFDIANTVEEQTIKTLPLNGRDALELVQLQAGVAGNFQQSEQGSAADQNRNVGGLGANGARAVNNAIYQDGVDITNSEFGASGNPDSEQFGITAGTDLQVSVDAVQEFRVIALNPTAEFGKNSGMQIEIVTKSGANTFDGSLYYFHRNTVLNANDFFNNLQGLNRPRLLRNQYGGSIGGPIIKNKTFFFFNYEGFKERSDTPVERTVFTQEARNGLFRYYLDGPNATSLVDPATGAPLTSRVGVMDVDMLDRTKWEGIGKDTSGAVARYVSLMPLPNFFGNPGDGRDGFNFASYRFNASDPVNRFNWVTKFDHNINNVHSVNFRYTHGEVTNFANLAPFPGLPARNREEEQNGASFNWVSAFSSSLINEFKVGVTRNTRRLGSSIENGGDIILDCDNTFDCLGTTNPDLTGEENFIARQTIQFTDAFTWTKGNHEFKFGYTYRTNPLNVQAASRQINLDFNTEPRNEQGSAVDLVALLGSPNPISTNDRIPAANFFNFYLGRMGGVFADVQAITTEEWGDLSAGRIRGFRQHEHSWFAQDSWRMTPNFTLNYGIRHEIFLVPYEVNSFYTGPSNTSLIAGMLGQPGDGCDSFGNPNDIMRCTLPYMEFGAIGPRYGTQPYPDDYNNFAPVVGFSWDPWGDGKTAIRASYRVAYDKIFTSTVDTLDSSAPGLSFTSVINGDTLRNQGITGLVIPSGPNAGQPRGPRLGDLQGTSVGGINLNGTFNLSNFLSAPGVNIPSAPLGEISPTRNSSGPFDFTSDFKTAYAQSWSLSVQREIARNTVLEGRYIGRKGTKEYLGLPGNEFRSPIEILNEIQELQYLLTGGNLGSRPGTLPSGFQEGTAISISQLFGSTPNSASNYSQWTPGVYNSYAFSQFANLYPFFLAGRNSFDNGVASAIQRNDFVSTLATIDNNTGFHSNTFFGSVPLGAVPSGMGLNPCPTGRDPNRNLFGCLPIIVGIAEDSFRPWTQFLNGPRITGNSAYSNYHALQLELTRRMTDGLQFQVNYTFSKNLDITSVSQPTGQDIVSFFCIRCDYSWSDNDLTHDFKTNWVWDIPIGRDRQFGGGMSGVADAIIGGWTVAGFLTASTDFPLNVAVNGRDRTAPASTAGIRPSWDSSVTDFSAYNDIGKVSKRGDGVFYFSPSEFDGVLTRTLIGELGNVPRNYFRGPGWFNVDFMVSKTFGLSGIGEDWALDFRAEFFNFFNHVNFANPSLNSDRGPYVDLSNPDAGKIISQLGNPRLIQFALKLRF